MRHNEAAEFNIPQCKRHRGGRGSEGIGHFNKLFDTIPCTIISEQLQKLINVSLHEWNSVVIFDFYSIANHVCKSQLFDMPNIISPAQIYGVAPLVQEKFSDV